MPTIEVKNAPLYDALLDLSRGSVKIVNAGQPLRISRYSPVLLPDGRRRLRAEYTDRGETYVISCPLCTDTRHRLHVNHRWAVKDRVTRDSNLHLAKCFNEGCTDDGEGQLKLLRLVFGKGHPDARNVDEPLPSLQQPPPPRPGGRR